MWASLKHFVLLYLNELSCHLHSCENWHYALWRHHLKETGKVRGSHTRSKQIPKANKQKMCDFLDNINSWHDRSCAPSYVCADQIKNLISGAFLSLFFFFFFLKFSNFSKSRFRPMQCFVWLELPNNNVWCQKKLATISSILLWRMRPVTNEKPHFPG